ncbi:hypothetical protein, partial [Salmonella enterica]|uniref:hypothetical protein n=1 Tax=Salmonella enterica TaxID=28901 RepID=UPI003D283723
MKGKQNFPHEIVHELMKGKGRSQVEVDLFQAQWEDIRQNIVQQMEAVQKKAEEEGATKRG